MRSRQNDIARPQFRTQFRPLFRLMVRVMAVATLCVSLPSHGVVTPLAALATGPEINKIVGVNHIHQWQTVDAQRLILSLSPERNYLVTLGDDCFALRLAKNVGVSTSNDTIYAGFDYITADGQECRIQRINELDRAQKVALTEA